MQADTFRTLSTPVTFEPPRVKGSRFLADAIPVPSPESARAALDEIRAREYSATHHVWAYRLTPDGQFVRYSDDGEPSGSGGQPILRAIEGADLTDVLVVVTRYYGGTKLGTGGLARAYGDAAASALAAGRVRTVVVRTGVDIQFSFDDTSHAMRLLERFDAKIAHQRYTAQGTELTLQVRQSQVEDFLEAFVNDTGGRGQIAAIRK